MLTIADVRAAAERIGPHIHHTPVLRSRMLDDLSGTNLFFKCENLQKAGAFKSRGAVNAVFALSAEEASRGVATHSSGNHGSALARAASIRGVPAYIVIPSNANAVKKAAINQYGAEVIECEPTLAAREATLEDVVRKTGACFIPPYDHDLVIAGQGTVALELFAEVETLTAIVTPVGGGGLLAGSAIVGSDAGVSVYGAEPEMADDAYRSFNTGERVTTHTPKTIADGLQTTLGVRNFEIIRSQVTDILLVSESEIIEAMRLMWTRLKLVVEPSSAVTLAAVLRHRDRFAGMQVGLVLTGGNVDLDQLPWTTR